MSAYVCDDSHITALARYAVDHNIPRPVQSLPPTIQDIGETLLAENVVSVNHRYPDRHAEAAFIVSEWALAQEFSPIQIVKACQCFGYQSCEHPGWVTSAACQIVKEIECAAIAEVPGYRDAKWHIEEA
jgi:hypothetical protein